MKQITYSLFIAALLISGCESSQYSEEQKEVLIEAQKMHFEALNIYDEGMEMLETITVLQDSLNNNVGTATRMKDLENVNTDSLTKVTGSFQTAHDQLISSQNALLQWPDSIYGLPEVDGIYDVETDNTQGIAKDDENDMISNNITYKDLPENISPEELRSLQEKQLQNIRSIHEDLSSALENAKKVLAENL